MHFRVPSLRALFIDLQSGDNLAPVLEFVQSEAQTPESSQLVDSHAKSGIAVLIVGFTDAVAAELSAVLLEKGFSPFFLLGKPASWVEGEFTGAIVVASPSLTTLMAAICLTRNPGKRQYSAQKLISDAAKFSTNPNVGSARKGMSNLAEMLDEANWHIESIARHNAEKEKSPGTGAQTGGLPKPKDKEQYLSELFNLCANAANADSLSSWRDNFARLEAYCSQLLFKVAEGEREGKPIRKTESHKPPRFGVRPKK
jgi:hypothetical protein